jgi:fatty acid omega-hydroxylase
VSSDMSHSPLAAAARAGKPASEPDPMEVYGKEPSMIMSDPPDHDRARRQAMRQFGPPHSPDLIPNMEADCHRVVNNQLDKARGKTRMDVVDDYAYPLPVAVICKILGVPLKDEPKFHAWIETMMAGVDLGPEGATAEGKRLLEKTQASSKELRQYLIELVTRFLREPGESMLAKMAHDAGPDGPMSPAELVSNSMLLLIAGHDSTVNLISHCVLTLLRNPGSFERLRARPELVPGAIEEVLRLQFFPTRTALADIEIAGTLIPKGSPVFLMYGAANRDPSRFPNAEEFDPERKDNEHFGWGSGIHTCFGGPLARLEVNVALETFLRRVKNPRLVVDPPPYRPNQIFRGPRHLLIDYDGIRD